MAVQQRHFPDLKGKAHEDVERAIRVIYGIAYDLQDAVNSLHSQLLGGALGTAVVGGGHVTGVVVTSGGYYIKAPSVVFSGNGTGAAGTAVLTGNKVTSVKMSNIGSGYTSATVSFVTV